MVHGGWPTVPILVLEQEALSTDSDLAKTKSSSGALAFAIPEINIRINLSMQHVYRGLINK